MSSSTAPLASQLDSILARLSALEGGAPPAPPSSSSSSSSSLPPFVAAYDAYCASTLAPFVAASETLGGGASKCGAAIAAAWAAQRSFLVAASQSKKPGDGAALGAALQPFFKPYMEAKGTIRPDRDEWELHMKTCGEVIGMLQW